MLSRGSCLNCTITPTFAGGKAAADPLQSCWFGVENSRPPPLYLESTRESPLRLHSRSTLEKCMDYDIIGSMQGNEKTWRVLDKLAIQKKKWRRL